VMMAALVAGFAFGVIQTPKTTPTASITARSDDSLLHRSGDLLNTSEIAVTFDGENRSDLESVSDASGSWKPGTTINFDKPHSGETVRLIYEPSGSTLANLEMPK